MTKSFMKNLFYIASLVIIAASVCVSDSEAASIARSKHDFSVSNATGTGTPFAGQFQVGPAGQWGATIDEICVFCHTPHGASQDSQTNTLLWNRVSSPPAGYSYKPYTASSSTTVAPDTGDGRPTGISMMCMSCHDGVTSIAVGTLLNAPGAGNPEVSLDPYSSITLPGSISDGGGFGAFGANIGNATSGGGTIDLSNDHPISFEWIAGKPGYFNEPTRSELRLFGATGRRIECATCHSVHNPSIVPFLAMSNSNSDMCRACHDK